MNFGKFWTMTLVFTGIIVVANVVSLTFAHAQSIRNVELILDASGSMNGKLSGGVRKIVAAKDAVAELVKKLPGDINLSFRAYGHQFHRSKHVCNDTKLIVPFGVAGEVASDIVANANSLDAQGYTPISLVLGLAADDLKPLDGKKTIILVSDGKETCEGDPCLLAKKLAEANADLTIHTVGLGVDFQTKTQLQCIASVARGNYFDANSTDELASSMEEAATLEIPVPETETITIKIKKPEFGHLQVINGGYNPVFDAETGEKAGTATSSDDHTVKLEPGIYNVSFGKGLLWKSVQVISGETTVISAGVLEINNNQYHQVRDPETEHVYTNYSSGDKALALPPGTYDITFDKALWRNVVITEGVTTTLEPAVLVISNNQYHGIIDPETGKKLMTYGSSEKRLAVPPGTYDISFEKALWKGIELKGGEKTVLEPAVLKIANNQYHHIVDAETGKRAISYSSSTNWLAMPPGKYIVKFQKTEWKIDLEEGKETILNPGGVKVTPKSYQKIYFAGSDKVAGTLGSSDERAMLASGEYYIVVGEQKVPFTISEGKIIEIKME